MGLRRMRWPLLSATLGYKYYVIMIRHILLHNKSYLKINSSMAARSALVIV